MRAAAALVLGAAGFAAFLGLAHRRGADLVASEERVLVRVRAAAAKGPGPPETAGGYRLAWEAGDGLPPLLVARPERSPEDGVRWFASPDGVTVYEFDTVLFRALAEGPDLRPLRAWLAAEERPKDLPPGWAPAD